MSPGNRKEKKKRREGRLRHDQKGSVPLLCSRVSPCRGFGEPKLSQTAPHTEKSAYFAPSISPRLPEGSVIECIFLFQAEYAGDSLVAIQILRLCLARSQGLISTWKVHLPPVLRARTNTSPPDTSHAQCLH